MGGSIGAWLHRAGHEVLLVDADPAHVEAIRGSGLRIEGPVDAFTVHPQALTPDEAPARVGVVLLAVKAHHTRAAVAQIAPRLDPEGFVVSVQNGLNERWIAEAVGPERTVGCLNFGADVIEPGVVMRGNRGAVVVGEMDGRVTDRIRTVHALFREFEPAAILTSNIEGYLWGKLAYGSILFATALAPASIAEVLESRRHRPPLIGLAREALRVAGAHGTRPEGFDGIEPADFAPDAGDARAHESLDRLAAFNRESAKSHSGVWRDLAVRKRRTEVDAQIGLIDDLGREVDIDCPLTRRLVALIHDVEEGRRDQSWATLDELAKRYPNLDSPSG